MFLKEQTALFIIQNAAIKHSVLLAGVSNIYLIKEQSGTGPETCLHYSWHRVGILEGKKFFIMCF